METIDIWVNCFFGGVDHSNRRLCQYDGHYGTAECNRECPFYLCKRDAIDICKGVMNRRNRDRDFTYYKEDDFVHSEINEMLNEIGKDDRVYRKVH